MSSNEQANDLEPLRFSRLCLMAKSAAHYAHGYKEETPEMREGSATHAYLLGQKHRVAVYTEGNRDKRHKKYQAFLEEHHSQLILSPAEMAPVEGMRRAIEAHPRAMELLDGIQEQRIYWDLGGRACAGTPDVVTISPNGAKRLVELKTSRTAAPGLFMWHAKKLGYHAQLAWYAEGLERALVYKPGPVTEHYIVAVESAAPYPVTVVRVCESMLDLGRRQWRLWFEQLANCERTGRFPAYCEAEVDWEDEEVELDWGGGEEAA